jgi:hypothetical protein
MPPSIKKRVTRKARSGTVPEGTLPPVMPTPSIAAPTTDNSPSGVIAPSSTSSASFRLQPVAEVEEYGQGGNLGGQSVNTRRDREYTVHGTGVTELATSTSGVQHPQPDVAFAVRTEATVAGGAQPSVCICEPCLLRDSGFEGGERANAFNQLPSSSAAPTVQQPVDRLLSRQTSTPSVAMPIQAEQPSVPTEHHLQLIQGSESIPNNNRNAGWGINAPITELPIPLSAVSLSRRSEDHSFFSSADESTPQYLEGEAARRANPLREEVFAPIREFPVMSSLNDAPTTSLGSSVRFSAIDQLQEITGERLAGATQPRRLPIPRPNAFTLRGSGTSSCFFPSSGSTLNFLAGAEARRSNCMKDEILAERERRSANAREPKSVRQQVSRREDRGFYGNDCRATAYMRSRSKNFDIVPPAPYQVHETMEMKRKSQFSDLPPPKRVRLPAGPPPDNYPQGFFLPFDEDTLNHAQWLSRDPAERVINPNPAGSTPVIGLSSGRPVATLQMARHFKVADYPGEPSGSEGDENDSDYSESNSDSVESVAINVPSPDIYGLASCTLVDLRQQVRDHERNRPTSNISPNKLQAILERILFLEGRYDMDNMLHNREYPLHLLKRWLNVARRQRDSSSRMEDRVSSEIHRREIAIAGLIDYGPLQQTPSTEPCDVTIRDFHPICTLQWLEGILNHPLLADLDVRFWTCSNNRLVRVALGDFVPDEFVVIANETRVYILQPSVEVTTMRVVGIAELPPQLISRREANASISRFDHRHGFPTINLDEVIDYSYIVEEELGDDRVFMYAFGLECLYRLIRYTQEIPYIASCAADYSNNFSSTFVFSDSLLKRFSRERYRHRNYSSTSDSDEERRRDEDDRMYGHMSNRDRANAMNPPVTRGPVGRTNSTNQENSSSSSNSGNQHLSHRSHSSRARPPFHEVLPLRKTPHTRESLIARKKKIFPFHIDKLLIIDRAKFDTETQLKSRSRSKTLLDSMTGVPEDRDTLPAVNTGIDTSANAIRKQGGCSPDMYTFITPVKLALLSSNFRTLAASIGDNSKALLNYEDHLRKLLGTWKFVDGDRLWTLVSIPYYRGHQSNVSTRDTIEGFMSLKEGDRDTYEKLLAKEWPKLMAMTQEVRFFREVAFNYVKCIACSTQMSLKCQLAILRIMEAVASRLDALDPILGSSNHALEVMTQAMIHVTSRLDYIRSMLQLATAESDVLTMLTNLLADVQVENGNNALYNLTQQVNLMSYTSMPLSSLLKTGGANLSSHTDPQAPRPPVSVVPNTIRDSKQPGTSGGQNTAAVANRVFCFRYLSAEGCGGVNATPPCHRENHLRVASLSPAELQAALLHFTKMDALSKIPGRILKPHHQPSDSFAKVSNFANATPFILSEQEKQHQAGLGSNRRPGPGSGGRGGRGRGRERGESSRYGPGNTTAPVVA